MVGLGFGGIVRVARQAHRKPNTGTPFTIGASADPNYYFAGKIDDARVYNRALCDRSEAALQCGKVKRSPVPDCASHDWNSVPVLVEDIKSRGLRNIRGVPLPCVTTVSTTSNLGLPRSVTSL
jgi:hypothetical protein